MEKFLIPILILALIILVVILIIFLFKKPKEKYIEEPQITQITREVIINPELEDDNEQYELIIPIEKLPMNIKYPENRLIKITDNSVVARISQTIPDIATTLAKTINNNALKKMEMYKAVIPTGANLTKSKQMEGAVRGFYKDAKGIQGHANLVKVDTTKISKAGNLANSAAGIMNVGSLVVGQYYMTEINDKLESMKHDIGKISDFQDKEFKSRILSLIDRVSIITEFSSDILENDELRKTKLHTLEDLDGEGTQLLYQVNLTLDDIINKNSKIDFKYYKETVQEISKLVQYQNILIPLISELSRLKYILGKGDVSSQMCYSMFDKYHSKSLEIKNSLVNWHTKQMETYGIDLELNRRLKKGVEGIVSNIPGAFDKRWRFKQLEEELAFCINGQINSRPTEIQKPRNLYEEDVEIIIKDGDYYYLKDAQ